MSDRHDNIIIKGFGTSAIGAGVFYVHETLNQRHVIFAPKEKSDKFIKSIANEKLREKYSFIRDNFNSTNTKKALAAKNISKYLKRMSAIGGAMFGGILFVGYLSFQSCFPKNKK